MHCKLLGLSDAETARRCNCDRETVARVKNVCAAEELDHVAKVRALFIGISAASLAAVQAAIENGDAQMAYKHLEDIGAVPNQLRTAAGMPQPQPATPEAAKEADEQAAEQALLARLPPEKQLIYGMLVMGRDKMEAYGYGRDVIQYPAPQLKLTPSVVVDKFAEGEKPA